ncbi:condensation domain-containing protein [Streptomyces lydicus]|nr:condensation domain-containing protein [Streptomyces lydicus]
MHAVRRVGPRGDPCPRPVATQYPDFAVWQRERLSGALLEEQLSYWTKQLDRAVPPALPLDRPRSGEEAGDGAVHTFRVPAATAARLREWRRSSTPPCSRP